MFPLEKGGRGLKGFLNEVCIQLVLSCNIILRHRRRLCLSGSHEQHAVLI